MFPKLAYSIEEFARETGLGRTRIYEAIRQGRLRAKKNGNRTLILAEHGMEFLRSLPDAVPNSATESEPPTGS